MVGIIFYYKLSNFINRSFIKFTTMTIQLSVLFLHLVLTREKVISGFRLSKENLSVPGFPKVWSSSEIGLLASVALDHRNWGSVVMFFHSQAFRWKSQSPKLIPAFSGLAEIREIYFDNRKNPHEYINKVISLCTDLYNCRSRL